MAAVLALLFAPIYAVESSPAPATAPSTAPAADAAPLKSKDGKTLGTPDQLAALPGDARAGEAVFRNAQGANCVQCHQVGTDGGMVGPPLTTIGQKLSKAQLHESILYPNAAILMSYESWLVKTKDGELHEGRLAEETPDRIALQDAQGNYKDIDAADIVSKKQQKVSIMPEGLHAAMTQQELLDLVEYLSTLRNAE